VTYNVVSVPVTVLCLVVVLIIISVQRCNVHYCNNGVHKGKGPQRLSSIIRILIEAVRRSKSACTLWPYQGPMHWLAHSGICQQISTGGRGYFEGDNISRAKQMRDFTSQNDHCFENI